MNRGEEREALRKEQKRQWRNSLNNEKLTKLREKDASRKRMARQNLTEEERNAIRTKDSARRAELRKMKRLKEKEGKYDTDSPSAEEGGDSCKVEQWNREGRKDDDDESDKRPLNSYRAIPIASLLNRE